MDNFLNNRVKIGNTPNIDCDTAQKVQNGEIDASELLKAAAELHTVSCKECIKKMQEQEDAET